MPWRGHYNAPLSDLFSHRRSDRVRLSWTVTGSTQAEVEESLREAEERGYRSCNVKVGGSMEWDLQLCAMVRSAFPKAFFGPMPMAAFHLMRRANGCMRS